ncbi:MAG: histidine--tRNA ligase [Clostridioides sp.]|jgi:histidyl-tRNA synthetase|nr:histidine--tRNA ligase [Clostridioides sp.]
MLNKAPRGTKDILPKEVYKWHFVEDKFKEVCSIFRYEEIRTPVFEHTELFERGVGDTTDIVQKEMYSFKDKGDRSLTLKPEGTAGVIRAFIENKMYSDVQPTKFFYMTPCFRYERPQAGRQREFHQFGIEALGSDTPSLDAEVISLAIQFFSELGIEDLIVSLNSVGCPNCRKEYDKVLRAYLESKKEVLCETCNERMVKNPMRVIDCKVPTCKENIKDIPYMLDYLCDDCREHFELLQKYLEEMNINYKIDKTIVRGLDYYRKTAFEIIADDLGAQSTVCAGGRYDGLVEQIGGPKGISGIGFGLGVERLLLLLENKNNEIITPDGADIFIVTIGDEAKLKSFGILSELRKNHITADKDHVDRSVKAQFKYSDKVNAKYTVVIGEDELKNDYVSLKNMNTSEQKNIKLSNLVEELKNLLNK